MSSFKYAVCVLAGLLGGCSTVPLSTDAQPPVQAPELVQPMATSPVTNAPVLPSATPRIAATPPNVRPEPVLTRQAEVVEPTAPAIAKPAAPAPPTPRAIDAATQPPATVAVPSIPAVVTTPPAARPVASTAPAPAKPSVAVATSSSLRGRIQLRARTGQTLAADEVRDAVLWFKPNRAVALTTPGRFTIDTRNKRFEPRTLVVPVGSSVDFPNSDPVIHNVFSLSAGSEFDLGLYGEGESAEAVLGKTGVVMAFCNVHYSMFAALVVVDTPYTAQVQADGSFELNGLPPGGGTLHLWHPRAEAWTQSLVLPSPAPMNVELAIIKTLIPQHTNKTGGSYRPTR
jgi:plastocyanin